METPLKVWTVCLGDQSKPHTHPHAAIEIVVMAGSRDEAVNKARREARECGWYVQRFAWIREEVTP